MRDAAVKVREELRDAQAEVEALRRDPEQRPTIESWNKIVAERDALAARLAEVERERDDLALSDSLDRGEIVDALTDAGLAPADYGGTIRSTVEFLIGLDRTTAANLAAAEARLEAVRKLCDQADRAQQPQPGVLGFAQLSTVTVMDVRRALDGTEGPR